MKAALVIVAFLAVAFFSFQAGKSWEYVKLLTNHTRFTKEVFYRLSLLPTTALPEKMKMFITDFEFPKKYNEEKDSSESDVLFRQFGIDDKTLHLN